MPRKFVQTPAVLVILYEASAGIRQIFTDGRPLPDNDPQPWWYGYSVGRWEGDTLVVETNGLRDDGWLDIIGSPLTDAAKITERFRRVSYGRMEIDVTVDDPKAYTKPWTVRVNQQIMPDDGADRVHLPREPAFRDAGAVEISQGSAPSLSCQGAAHAEVAAPVTAV